MTQLEATKGKLCPGVAASFGEQSGCMDVVLRVQCGRGVYVRSIARDIGEILGVGGCLVRLVRTKSDGFSLSDAVRLEDLSSADAMLEALAPPGLPFLDSSTSSTGGGDVDDDTAILELLGRPRHPASSSADGAGPSEYVALYDEASIS